MKHIIGWVTFRDDTNIKRYSKSPGRVQSPTQQCSTLMKKRQQETAQLQGLWDDQLLSEEQSDMNQSAHSFYGSQAGRLVGVTAECIRGDLQAWHMQEKQTTLALAQRPCCQAVWLVFSPETSAEMLSQSLALDSRGLLLKASMSCKQESRSHLHAATSPSWDTLSPWLDSVPFFWPFRGTPFSVASSAYLGKEDWSKGQVKMEASVFIPQGTLCLSKNWEYSPLKIMRNYKISLLWICQGLYCCYEHGLLTNFSLFKNVQSW